MSEGGKTLNVLCPKAGKRWKRPADISREEFPSDGWQGALSLSPWHGIGGRFGFGISPLSSPAVPPCMVRFRVALHCALTLSASEGHHGGRLIKACERGV